MARSRAATRHGARRARPRRGAAEVELDGLRPASPARPRRASTGRPWPAAREMLERRLLRRRRRRARSWCSTRAARRPTRARRGGARRRVARRAPGRAGGCALLLPGDRRPRRSDATCAAGRRCTCGWRCSATTARPRSARLERRRGPVIYVVAAARRRGRRARSRARPRRGGCLVVVPAALAGRRALFTVAGCTGLRPHALARRRRRRAVAARARERRAPARSGCAAPGRAWLCVCVARSWHSRLLIFGAALGGSPRSPRAAALAVALALTGTARSRDAPAAHRRRRCSRASACVAGEAARRRACRCGCSTRATGTSSPPGSARASPRCRRDRALPRRRRVGADRHRCCGGDAARRGRRADRASGRGAAGARRFRRPVPLTLAVLYAMPAVQRSGAHPWAAGALFALLLCRFVPRRPPRRCAGALPRRRGRARRRRARLLVAPRARRRRAGASTAGDRLRRCSPTSRDRFDWNHGYGPLDWPRDGRELLRVKAQRAAYWKAEDLDALRRRAAGARSRARARSTPIAEAAPRAPALAPARSRVTVARPAARAQFVAAGGDAVDLGAPRPRAGPARGRLTCRSSRDDLRRRRRLHGAESTTRGRATGQLRTRAGRPTRRPGRRQRRSSVAARRLQRPASLGSHVPAVRRAGRRPIAAARGDRRRTTRRVLERRRLRARSTRSPSGSRAARRRRTTTCQRVARLPRSAASATPRRRRVAPYPLDAFLFDDQARLLPAVLRRDGAAAAHGRRARRASPPASRPARSTRKPASTSSATSTPTPGSRCYFPRLGWVTVRPDAGRLAPRAQPADRRGQRPRPPATRRGRGAGGDRGRRDPRGAAAAAAAAAPAAHPARARRRRAALARAPAASAVALRVGAAGCARRDRRARRARARAAAHRPRPPRPGTTLRALERRFAGTPEARAATCARCALARYGRPAAPRRRARSAARCAGRSARGLGPAGRLRALWALPPRRRLDAERADGL